MTDQEYINVRELSDVMQICKLIGGVVVENSVGIHPDDMKQLKNIAFAWQDRMFQVCKTIES